MDGALLVIVPALTTVLTVAIKKVIDHYGYEMISAVTQLTAFGLSLLGAWLFPQPTLDFWAWTGVIFTTQMSAYELILKRILDSKV